MIQTNRAVPLSICSPLTPREDDYSIATTPHHDCVHQKDALHPIPPLMVRFVFVGCRAAMYVACPELVMAVGLVVDYMVHIVHYFLHQVHVNRSSRWAWDEIK